MTRRSSCRMSGVDISVLAFTLTLAGFAVSSANAQAQAEAPVPLEQPLPEAPRGRGGNVTEGWIVVRYSVLADGSTDAVIVVDKLPPQLNHRDTVAAVEDWRFNPARVDGEAVDWHNNEAVIVLRGEGVPVAPGAAFAESYRAIAAMVDAGELEEALRENERQQRDGTENLREIALLLVQNATIQLRLGNAHAARAAITRATDPGVPTITGNELEVALQYRNTLELQLGDLIGALETLERRNAYAPVPADDIVAGNVAAIEKALADGSAIVHQVQLLEVPWWHALDRRTFAITVVDGSVDSIDVACDRRVAELEYAPDAEWSLPESWGACTVAVHGDENSEFQFFEFQ